MRLRMEAPIYVEYVSIGDWSRNAAQPPRSDRFHQSPLALLDHTHYQL